MNQVAKFLCLLFIVCCWPMLSEPLQAQLASNAVAPFTCAYYRSASVGTGNLISPLTGTNRVLYIRARFADEKGEPVTEEEARQDLTETARLFTAISYGKFTIDSVITPVIVLPKMKAEYEAIAQRFYPLVDDARAAAALPPVLII